MSANCDVIIIFFYLWPIWSNQEAGFWMHVLQLTLLLIIAFYLIKTEKLSSRTIALSKGTIFAKKRADLLRKF